MHSVIKRALDKPKLDYVIPSPFFSNLHVDALSLPPLSQDVQFTSIAFSMPNPFIDDRAHEDAEDFYDDEDEEYEQEQDDRQWIDLDDDRQELSDFQHHAGFYQQRIEDIERRYCPGTGTTELETSNEQGPAPPTPTRSEICDFDENKLKSVLMSAESPPFWRVKCKVGRETDLVLDIMNSVILEPANTPTTLPPSNTTIGQVTLTHSSSPAALALRSIRQYALTQIGEPKDMADKIGQLLGPGFTVEWNRLIDAAGLEPGLEDVLAATQDALETINKKAAMFLPRSILAEAEALASLPDDSTSSSVTPSAPTPISHPGGCHSCTLLSAFTVPTVQGCVYLEGRCDEKVHEWLGNHAAVVKRQSRVWMEHMDCREIAVLLDTQPLSLQPCSWVRVTRGLYRGDVGLVVSRQMLADQHPFEVLLVPRIPPPQRETPPTPPPKETHPLLQHSEPDPSLSSPTTLEPTDEKKRRRGSERFSQRLFHEVSFQGQCEKMAENVYRWNNDEYRHGLVVKYYDSRSLSQTDVIMDRNTRRLFGLSQAPSVMTVSFPVIGDWVFFAEEKVEAVVLGPLNQQQKLDPTLPRSTYLKGGIIFNDYDECDNDDTSVQVSNINLRKRVYIGDSVAVEAGEMRGREGMVTSMTSNTLEVLELGGELTTFRVEVNSCRVTALRSTGFVPWVDKHVTIVLGDYKGYSGFVIDTHPPKPQYTTLQVKIPSLGVTVQLRHDHIVDTISKQYLRFAAPLNQHQQQFAQLDWDAYRSPNLTRPPVDPFSGRWIQAEDILNRQPQQPWLNVPISVIRGQHKGTGTVKQVERSHHTSSKLRVLVEHDFVSAEHGAAPQYWSDYEDIRDPRTGLPLHIVYPLHGRQRYWEPRTRVKAVSVPNPYLRPNHGLRTEIPSTVTPPGSPGPFIDPFAGPSESSSGTEAAHWAADPRLGGKTFYARWHPQSGSDVAKILATPITRSRMVQVKEASGMGGVLVPPDEIYDVQVPIKPTTNRQPLLVVRGEHTGKYLRQIWCRYRDKDDEHPVITAAVFEDWGTTTETMADPYYIEVKAEDCAEAADDLNKEKFKQTMKELREEARKPQAGCKTKKKAYKPRR
ncbi:hypothetical protein K435DRAFT_798955 [Dendrothele bispora CBS 962.96]|uniref:Chromatin elongation factor spt5 n=1 Tax=Dendrothele bispora (strain CBS 962.96) TaxID=1314807 RepID=A0A4S8LYU6_DENBC|nr:hypothetical protein K435DRAFT_798955 [Dendrothele bispora CBS 962.96]